MSEDLALHVLDCGTLTVPRLAVFHNEGTEPLTVPTPGFLIRHPRGNVVYEGGNQLEITQGRRDYWVGLDAMQPNVTPGQHVLAQVEALDVDPGSVRHVVVSHLHMDHTGAIGHFPAADHVVHGEELAFARDPDWYAVAGYQRQDFERPGVRWSPLHLTEQDPVHDLYGDGTIKLIYSPGHAVGILSMLVDLPQTGPVLLPSDAADTRAHWEHRALPSYIDARAVVRSIDRLKRMREEVGAETMIYTHDPDQWPTVRKGADAYL